MILFPAIDLKDGRCVRLQQGDMAKATIFNEDPPPRPRLSRAKGSNTSMSSISTAPSPGSR